MTTMLPAPPADTARRLPGWVEAEWRTRRDEAGGLLAATGLLALVCGGLIAWLGWPVGV